MDTGGPGNRRPEINVTPLVDVCLVLLIIFMVMSPKQVPELSVRVPPDGPPNHAHGESLVVHMEKSGALALGNEAMANPEVLGERLTKVLESREKKVVFTDFDPEVDYGEAIDVVDTAKRSGARVIGVTKMREPAPDQLLPVH